MSFEPPVRCATHGGPVDLHDPDVLFEVRGWVERRRGGGVHHVRFKEETGRIMCGICARKRERGAHPQQESLL
jgi:hypothetical protein